MHRFSHHAMACTFELAIVHPDAAYAREAALVAFEEIDRLEGELSRFVPTSDVSQINALQPGQPLIVGIGVIECLTLARRVWDDTRGAFDPTVGGWIVDRGSADRPSIGMDLIEIDAAARTVRVLAGGITLDLGAIGKGYALDQAAAILRDWNIESALLHSGQSTALAMGEPTGEGERPREPCLDAGGGSEGASPSQGLAAWRISLRDPRDQTSILDEVALRDRAFSGSGMALHGRHILDPRTGLPAAGKLATWALAPTAALSDAISTAFMVMGLDEIAAYCRTHRDVNGMVLEEGANELRRFG